MCIFSPPVSSVEGTKIFARQSADSRQFLVYSMGYQSKQDMAMILPLPVGSHDEDATVRFIALDSYESFFNDMYSGFPELMMGIPRGMIDSSSIHSSQLKVYEVGDYSASFIPTLKDFDRLDARFRLSRKIWDQLPEYQSYGFAVFKLRKANPSSIVTPHPIAFEFVTRWPNQLFFPTIHIHDGSVHERSHFDHHLYYQGDEFSTGKEFQSDMLASEFMDVARTKGLIDGQKRCHMIVMSGQFKNQDTVLSTI
jgi:hypothetical protein